MQDVLSRMQFFRRMHTRNDSAKISNVNICPCRGTAKHSKWLPFLRYYGGVRIWVDEIRSAHARERSICGLYKHVPQIKAEARGYPSWVRNLVNEERYVGTFNAKEGVLMMWMQ